MERDLIDKIREIVFVYLDGGQVNADDYIVMIDIAIQEYDHAKEQNETDSRLNQERNQQ